MRWLLIALLALHAAACSDRKDGDPPLVLAAASLRESMEAAADAFAARGHVRPVISFAATPALARQIEKGAKADLFVSADRAWMDRVERAGRLEPGSRNDLAANRLVLVAPLSGPERVGLETGDLLRAIGEGRLAMADPASVPAGRYGKSALETLGLWDRVRHRVAPAENVRAALMLVERGEAALGIVYATDARASEKVRIVANILPGSHDPVVYPVALLAGADQTGRAFHHFLLSADGQAIFAAFGFERPPS